MRKKPRKRLSDACRATASKVGSGSTKRAIAEAIGDGTWREHFSPQEIFDYCEEDVRMSVKLLRAQLRGNSAADVDHVLHWSNYSAKAIALIQARGMPIDMALWNLVQENKAAVIGELLRQFDPSYGSEYPIYTPEGEWSYERFERWLVYAGVAAWPRLDSGRLDIDSDAFRLMYHVPGIEALHALRDSLGFIVKARCRSAKTGAIALRCFRSAPRPAATLTAKARTTRTPACALSWCFRLTRSAFISTGGRRKSVLPRLYPMIRR